jgi:hypothetical protein
MSCKSGYIYKRGRSLRANWKKRFVILASDAKKLTLTYYDKPNGTEKGSVLIYPEDEVPQRKIADAAHFLLNALVVFSWNRCRRFRRSKQKSLRRPTHL